MGSEKDDDGHTSSVDGLGLSLWLVPPEDSEIHDILVDAIARMVPSALAAGEPLPQFEPHLTLASHIPRQSITGDPQTWLDEIDLPATSAVEVDFQELAIGDAFFKKLFIRCRRSDSLLSLASACRELSAGVKVDEALYDPHVSLLYSHEHVDEDVKRLIEQKLEEKGIMAKTRASGGWSGGTVWLVPTQKDIAEWQPIARRSLI